MDDIFEELLVCNISVHTRQYNSQSGYYLFDAGTDKLAILVEQISKEILRWDLAYVTENTGSRCWKSGMLILNNATGGFYFFSLKSETLGSI